MTDRLVRLLEESRERYVAHYRAVVRRLQADRPNVVAELLLELGDPKSGLVRRLTRVDVIWGGPESPSVVEANIDPIADPDRCLYSEAGPPELRIFPLVWNACEVVLPEPLLLGPDFTSWYERWMDLADAREAGEDGLAGVIHSVTVPGPASNGWGFSVDLGSAAAEALLELLRLPSLLAAPRVDVGSFAYR